MSKLFLGGDKILWKSGSSYWALCKDFQAANLVVFISKDLQVVRLANLLEEELQSSFKSKMGKGKAVPVLNGVIRNIFSPFI